MKKKLLSIVSVALVLLSVMSLVACGKTYSEIKWPTSGIAAKLPKPESTKGEIESEREDYFRVNVAETSKEAFNKYVDAVKAKGFTVDYSSSDDRYSADDKEGNSVSIYFEDGNIMEIRINAVTDESEIAEDLDAVMNETDEPKTEAKAEKKKSNSSVSPDFKDTMDSYESFMNEYVDFMKKYNSSGDVTSMLSDYTNYLSKYTELVQKINAIDQSSLSEADAAYYLEVTTRVAKKLAEVGQ